MNNDVLIVMQKNAILGKVKTRLAIEIGDKDALKVYEQLISTTYSNINSSAASVQIHYSDFIEEKNNTNNFASCRSIQTGSDLGERMWNASKMAFFNGATKVLIIGTDCPELSAQDIINGFTSLDDHDIVIGPSRDGGYYLLGMKAPIQELFIGKDWSTTLVLEQTTKSIKQLGLSYHLLRLLNDIDTYDDLKNYSGLFN